MRGANVQNLMLEIRAAAPLTLQTFRGLQDVCLPVLVRDAVLRVYFTTQLARARLPNPQYRYRKHDQKEQNDLDGLEKQAKQDDMQALRKRLGVHLDLAEVYSPPRVHQVLRELKMIPGHSLDLTVPRPDGSYWNFAKPADRMELWTLIRKDQPFVIIGSPPCTAFSAFQHLMKHRPGGGERLRRLRRDGGRHLQFCCELYAHQISGGLYFAHEHPLSAESWETPCVVRLLATPGVMASTIGQCAYGLNAGDGDEIGPAKKPTRHVTNSVETNKEMQLRCPGCPRHIQLLGGKAAKAAFYPRGLCIALARGITNHMKHDCEELMGVEVCGELSKEEKTELDELRAREEAEGWIYWDDVSGKELNSDLVKAARKEQLDVVRKMQVWKTVPREQCIAETGRQPIGKRWVDTNKGDDVSPRVRSRIVARELKRRAEFELLAATPPIDYITFLLFRSASGQHLKSPSCIMIVDVKKAYFYAPSTRRVYVEIPKEDWEKGDENDCALLLKSFYGTRDAALIWSVAYGDVLAKLGFTNSFGASRHIWERAEEHQDCNPWR